MWVRARAKHEGEAYQHRVGDLLDRIITDYRCSVLREHDLHSWEANSCSSTLLLQFITSAPGIIAKTPWTLLQPVRRAGKICIGDPLPGEILQADVLGGRQLPMGTLEFSVFGVENDSAVLWSFSLIFFQYNLKEELGPAHLVIRSYAWGASLCSSCIIYKTEELNLMGFSYSTGTFQVGTKTF